MNSDSYNFTSKLAIEMYLYRQARCLLYTEYHASALSRGDSSLLIEKQLHVGVQNVRAKNFPVNIDVDLYTLGLLILP